MGYNNNLVNFIKCGIWLNYLLNSHIVKMLPDLHSSTRMMKDKRLERAKIQRRPFYLHSNKRMLSNLTVFRNLEGGLPPHPAAYACDSTN